MGVMNAMTVDVEDYFHVSAFAGCIKQDDWDTYKSRVVSNTQRLLDLFERNNTKITFFCSGLGCRTRKEVSRRNSSTRS